MSDDDNSERMLKWLAFTVAACVIALMVAGTAYVLHRVWQAW